MTSIRESHGGDRRTPIFWVVLNVIYASVLVALAMTPTVPSSAAKVPDVVAHAVAYGIQCFLLFALIRDYLHHFGALLTAAAGATCYGALTEGLQMLQPSRAVEIGDIAANTVGVAVVSLAIAVLWRERRHGNLDR